MNKIQVIILFITAMIFESFCQSIQQQIQELILNDDDDDDDDENVIIENIRISKLKNETLKFECRLSNNNEATFTLNQTYMTFNSKYMTLKTTIKDDISEPIFELTIFNLNPNRDAGIYRCNDKVWIITFDATLTPPKEEIIEQILEGKFRPGHFNGMLTVVLKYLNIVRPTRAYYGEKDYQQLLLIKKMAQALFLETEITACLTVRAEDGLASSSRNSRLTTEQRGKASHFPKMLKKTQNPALIAKQLEDLGFKVDYVADQWERRLAAVWLGDIRLIDNVSLRQVKSAR